MRDNDRDSGPWYREPWAWFVLTPLIVVVIVSLSFVAVAVRHADDTVIDNYYKEGRMINQSLAQDRRAANWQLSADVRWLADARQLEVTLHSPIIPHPDQLSVWLDHPFEKDMDRALVLEPIAENRYRVSWSEPPHPWFITLAPGRDLSARGDSPWRLRGEVDFTHNKRWTLEPGGEN